MSFFSWLSGSSRRKPSTPGESTKSAALPQRLAPDAAQQHSDRKHKRHARREQLYVSIREAMTRAGVLSASYKFKVLSLDQRGNEFLVMVDFAKAFGVSHDLLPGIESLIVQNARARFGITVPAVYWRMDEAAVVVKPRAAAEPEAQAAAAPAKPRYEPIQADEVAAFKQALLAASSQGAAVVAENGVKTTRSGPHSYTLLTGFEDTEMPESTPSPLLSSTQYGDLN